MFYYSNKKLLHFLVAPFSPSLPSALSLPFAVLLYVYSCPLRFGSQSRETSPAGGQVPPPLVEPARCVWQRHLDVIGFIISNMGFCPQF